MLPSGSAMPIAGSTRPNTVSAGSCTTYRHSVVSTITFNSTFVNKPKKPFQSPGTHQRATPCPFVMSFPLFSFRPGLGPASACKKLFESLTQPNMPPWALIILSAACWNSGKYEPTQSSSTRQS
jgi:hypothetical protein